MFLKLFFILLQGFNTQGTYFVSESSSQWTGQKDCAFANPPPINFAEEKITVQIIDLNTSKDEKIWIGYFKKNSGFEYTDCASLNDTKSWLISKAISESSPGKCYSACKNSLIIGVTENQCYCAENGLPAALNMTNQHCTSQCKSPKGVACGGTKDGTQYISLYRFSLNVTDANDLKHSRDHSRSCLSLEPQNKNYYWWKCTGDGSSLLKMCVRDGNVYAKTNIWQNWLDTVSSCYSNNSRPTNYLNSKLVPVGAGSELWTGIIRSQVIYNVGAENIPKTNDIEYGYLKRKGNSDTYELKFEQANNENRRYICFKGDVIETTKTTRNTEVSDNQRSSPSTNLFSSKSTTEKSTLSNNITTTKDMTQTQEMTSSSLPETVTSRINISTGTEPVTVDEQEVDSKGSKGSDVGAIIGASIVSVLIVIVAVVVFVVLKRRKKIPLICKGTLASKESRYQQSESTVNQMSREDHVYDHASAVNMSSANSMTNTNNNYSHTYLVLEPDVKESNTDDTTYDTSGNDNNTITENDNVYNKLELDDSKTYDHAHTNKRNGKRKPDDTYDTTEKAAMKLKARPSKDSDTFGHTGEDEYSHITKKQVNNCRTDNVYGVPNKLENAYGDVGTSHKNNPHDEGDTYSHINNKQ